MCYDVYRGSFFSTPKEKLWPALWFSLFVIIVSTLTILFDILPLAFSMLNSLLCLALIFVCIKADVICSILFVRVSDEHVEYYAEEKDQMIVIPVKEITAISSKFCRLYIHTHDDIHCINLLHVKREKNRWELKEMIKQVAQH